jgi:hypothetical protein
VSCAGSHISANSSKHRFDHLLWQRILQALARFQFEELIDNGIEVHHCRLGLGSNIIPVTDIYRTAIQLFLARHYPYAVGV